MVRGSWIISNPVTYVIRRLTNGITVMCITRGFMVGLGNNGFMNLIISSCLEISSTYNPFSSRFPFPVTIDQFTLRLRSTGSWKLFRGPQKLCFDSIKTTRYVIIDKSLMAFAVNACLFALVLA